MLGRMGGGSRARATAAAGCLLIAAGFAILMGIITAEALFPVPYDTAENTVSDLASTWQPGSVVRQPSATIFNLTMIGSGLLIAAGSLFYRRAAGARGVWIPLLVLGVAVFLVGIFPGENIDGTPSSQGVHPIVSMIAFLSGGLTGILAFRVTSAPFRHLSLALGGIAIAFLIMSGPLENTTLGSGGVERWVAYPVVLWLVAFGGYLLGPGTASRLEAVGK